MNKCYVCHQECKVAIVQDTYTGLCDECYAKVRSLIGGAAPNTVKEIGHMTIARPDVGAGLYIIDKSTGEIISRPIGVCIKCGREGAVLSNIFPYCEECANKEVVAGD